MKIDSNLSAEQAIIQNPDFPAPKNILEEQILLTVSHWGFDDIEHSGQIVVHKLVAPDVVEFFKAAFKLKFPIKSVIPIDNYAWDDTASCMDNNSSGFNYRNVVALKKLSKHALGCAFDINPVQNVYIGFDKNLNEEYHIPEIGAYETKKPGTLAANHPLVTLMKERGWIWGGDWTPDTGRVDYQHFEKVPSKLEKLLKV